MSQLNLAIEFYRTNENSPTKFLLTDNESVVAIPEYLSFTTSPNPFNPNVKISVTGWKSGTELKILNISGKVVANLTSVLNNGSQNTKHRQAFWNAAGHASGVYVVLLKEEKREIKNKIVLVR